VRAYNKRLRIAILSDDRPGFQKVMAESLHRIVEAAGAKADIFADGLGALRRVPDRVPVRSARDVARYAVEALPICIRFAMRFRRYDAIVVSNSLPEVFLRTFFNDERVRALLPRTPILLYDVFYLPTRGHWWRWLRDGKPNAWIPAGHQWGMERYDWYLCASVVSEVPLAAGLHPYSQIGLNLDDGTLYPEQGGQFVALIDFAQEHHESERAIQIAACQEAEIPYIELRGRYTVAEIRQIYRRCSVYFVGFRESFGIPICELQASGSYVFLAHAHWAPSHWLKSDLTVDGPGQLSPNFVVYDNDKAQLVAELRRVKASYDAGQVVSTFRQYHPQLHFGDAAEMRTCLDMLHSGAIHSRSHEAYALMPITNYRGRFSDQLELVTEMPNHEPDDV
jgi:hypothetical protein